MVSLQPLSLFLQNIASSFIILIRILLGFLGFSFGPQSGQENSKQFVSEFLSLENKHHVQNSFPHAMHSRGSFATIPHMLHKKSMAGDSANRSNGKPHGLVLGLSEDKRSINIRI